MLEDLTFKKVFTFYHLFKSYKKCCEGVRWKTSTKNYILKAIQHLSKTFKDLIEDNYKAKPFALFEIHERGKSRNIKASHIIDRVVQRCFCDYYLVPLLESKLIYDNGACMRGKGTKFTVDRLKAHLQQYYRQNGYKNNGYVLTFDFSKFFESIDHKILLDKVKKVIIDDQLFLLYKYMVECFKGGKGLGLGSQISQISALFFTNEIDHYIKEKLKMRFYGRYMDDGYIIHKSKRLLEVCRNYLIEAAKALNLIINIKKTKIWKIEKGFIFLNKHWYLKETSYVKIKPTHKAIFRLKRRYTRIIKKKDIACQLRYKASLNGYLIQFTNKERLEEYVYN